MGLQAVANYQICSNIVVEKEMLPFAILENWQFILSILSYEYSIVVTYIYAIQRNTQHERTVKPCVELVEPLIHLCKDLLIQSHI